MARSDSLSLNVLLEEKPRQPPDTSTKPPKPPWRPLDGCSSSTLEQHKQPMPKGYNKEVLTGAVQPKVLCVCCDHILRDPVQSRCGHRYCRGCFISAVEAQAEVKCPACIREDAEDTDLASLNIQSIIPDHAVRRDMAALDAKCDNSDCDWTGTFGNFLKHEKICKFKKMKCACEMMVCSNKMADHKKVECRLRVIKCMHCAVDIIAKDQDEHERSCEFYPEICDGCRLKMPKKQIMAHIDPLTGDCMNRKCPFNCGVSNTPKHQNDKIVDHLSALLLKVVTLSRQIEGASNNSQATKSDILAQTIGELETKVTEMGQQVHSQQGANRRPDDTRHGDAGASSVENKSLVALTEKQQTVESLLAVLNRQLEKVIVEFNGLEHQRRVQTEEFDTLQRKVTSLERSDAVKDVSLAELDLRVQALDKTSFDGILVWRITDFSRKRQEATTCRALSIYSAPFYTSRSGYKMCLRVYLNGDGMGKATHISLFFVVMRGQYDAILPWPFRQKVTLMLLDQENMNHLIDAFRPDPTSSSFIRPATDMNIASGCPLFCPFAKLDQRKPAFIKDDTIFIKAIVDQSGIG